MRLLIHQSVAFRDLAYAITAHLRFDLPTQRLLCHGPGDNLGAGQWLFRDLVLTVTLPVWPNCLPLSPFTLFNGFFGFSKPKLPQYLCRPPKLFYYYITCWLTCVSHRPYVFLKTFTLSCFADHRLFLLFAFNLCFYSDMTFAPSDLDQQHRLPCQLVPFPFY